MSVDWSAVPPRQLRALQFLDFAVPLHETHLRRRYSVRGSTVTAIIKKGWAREEYLSADGQLGCYFISLTQAGDELVKDLRRWEKRVQSVIEAELGQKSSVLGDIVRAGA